MGRPGMAKKQQNSTTQGGGRRRLRRCVRRRLTVKFYRKGDLAVLLLPGQRMYQGGGLKRLPRPKPVWPKNGSKQPNSGSTGFAEFF